MKGFSCRAGLSTTTELAPCDIFQPKADFFAVIDVNSNSYRNFMKVSGADSGQGNGIYPAAYYFFEKKRIAEGKPKSKKRLDNEDFLGYRGYSTDRPVQKWYVVKV